MRVVTQAVKGWIERLDWIWVEGQLIEINRRSGSRTVFLTLRDKLAEISVSIAISPSALDVAGPLTEGSTVAARLKPSFYAPTGRFSFYCDEIRPLGEGRLLVRLEQTKRMLQAEGLFNPGLKKKPPFLPQAIGLITGAGSAAERDVVENSRRRWPAVRIETRHALVQGPQACEQVISALRQLDTHPAVDVIVIARGGGSLEDLLPFSNEALVRAVHACRTPVVSAIGHETDNPILDLVADLHASTPTDAAKRIVPDAAEERKRIEQGLSRVRQATINVVRQQQERLDAIRTRPVLADPTASFALRYEELESLLQRAGSAIDHRIRYECSAIEHTLARVRTLSPKATLERGYSILVDGGGHAVTSVGGVEAGDDLLAHLSDGQLILEVRDGGPDNVGPHSVGPHDVGPGS